MKVRVEKFKSNPVIFCCSQMKANLLFLVLLSIGYCYSSDLYIDSALGKESSTSCSSSNPCLSIQNALEVFGNSTEDLNIYVTGTFNSVNNTNIIFPNVSVTIAPTLDEAYFDCENNLSSFFKSYSSLTIANIYFSNCEGGIQILDGNLHLDTVIFDDIDYSIYFNGNILDIQHISIRSDDVPFGLYIEKATSVSATNINISGTTEYAIQMNINNTINQIILDTIIITNSGGISISVPETINFDVDTLILKDIDMKSNILTKNAITLVNGKWNIKKSGTNSISSCINGIEYIGNGSFTGLNINGISIFDCESGIIFNAPGNIDIDGSYIKVNDTGFSTNQANYIEIENDCKFVNSNPAINITIDNYFESEISSSSFENTGPIIVTSSLGTNSTIIDVSISSPIENAININGGHWGIHNVDISNIINYSGNGGCFNLGGIESSFVIDNCKCSNSHVSGYGGAIYTFQSALAINNCEFTDCSASSGGALYALDYSRLSIKDTEFSSNFASQNGGAVNLESHGFYGADVYVENIDCEANQAYDGSCISCCSIHNCNINLIYDSENTIILTENEDYIGNEGEDITCSIELGTFETAATDPSLNTDNSTSSEWIFWIVGIVCSVCIVALCLIVVIAIPFYKKRIKYMQIE